MTNNRIEFEQFTSFPGRKAEVLTSHKFVTEKNVIIFHSDDSNEVELIWQQCKINGIPARLQGNSYKSWMCIVPLAYLDKIKALKPMSEQEIKYHFAHMFYSNEDEEIATY